MRWDEVTKILHVTSMIRSARIIVSSEYYFQLKFIKLITATSRVRGSLTDETRHGLIY